MESTVGFGKVSMATTGDVPVQEVSDVSYIISVIYCTTYTQITAVKKNTGTSSDVTDISHLVRRKLAVSLMINDPLKHDNFYIITNVQYCSKGTCISHT